MGKRNDRTGQIKRMNNGMLCKIIECDSCESMTVEFEDKTIVTGVRSCHWLRGKVANPNYRCNNAASIQEYAIYYYLRKYGFEKIEHGKGKDIGIENFELDCYHREKNLAIEYDGHVHDFDESIERDIRKNKICKDIGLTLYRLRSPRLKTIMNDNSNNYVLDPKKEIRSGYIDCKEELEEILTKHEIEFHKDDIDFVRDEEDIVREYGEKHVNAHAKEREKDKIFHRKTNQYMYVDKYYTRRNVTIRWDDGAIRTGVLYTSFLRGTVRHPMHDPKHIKESREKEKSISKHGEEMCLKTYRNATDIDVYFPSTNTLVQHKNYADFKRGEIGNPNFNKK